MIPFTLMTGEIFFSETSDLSRATRHHIPESGIVHRVFYSAMTVATYSSNSRTQLRQQN
jgi:hypothetical protein